MPPKTPIGELVITLRAPATEQQVTEAVDETIAGATAKVSDMAGTRLYGIANAATHRAAELVDEGQMAELRTLGRDTDAAVLGIIRDWEQPPDPSLDTGDPRALVSRMRNPGGESR